MRGKDERHDGEVVAALLRRGKPWWEIRVSDINELVRTLPPAARADWVNGGDWIGHEWAGVGDVAIGSTLVERDYLAELRRWLRSLLQERAHRGPLPLNDPAFRVCRGYAGRMCLAIEFDIGGTVVPIGLYEHDLVRTDPAGIASMVINTAIRVCWLRPNLLERRSAAAEDFAAQLASNGARAMPLFLRLQALPYNSHPKYLPTMRFATGALMLDETLTWAPAAAGEIAGTTSLSGHWRWKVRQHRRRAGVLRQLESLGSEGFISEMAVSLAQEHGLAPHTALRKAKAAALMKRRGTVDLTRNNRRESLRWRDGCISSFIDVGIGEYCDGHLVLRGEYPETLATAFVGRRLSSIVDHPAFRRTDPKVTSVIRGDGHLILRHAVRKVTVEQAEGRLTTARARAGKPGRS